MSNLIFRLIICLVLTFPLSILLADETAADPVKISLFSDKRSAAQDNSFWVSLHVHLTSPWHAYWKNPGDAGMAPSIEWELPEGFIVEAMEWPVPEKHIVKDIITFGYNEDFDILALIKTPSTVKDQTIELKAMVNWVVCSEDTCLPGSSEASFKMPLSSIAENHPDNAAKIQGLLDRLPKKLKAAAARQDQFLRVSFEHPLEEGEDIAFFPEDSGVDYHQEPLLSKEEQGLHLLLKAGDESADLLKGLLAVGGKWYAIEAPIAKDAEQIVEAESGVKPSLDTEDAQALPDLSAFAVALGLAFLGGMILNLMPCVLPVVSFKIMSFVNMSGQKRLLIFKHGLAFTLGVLISFWVLAGMLLMLRAYGHSVGWGFQLQEPIFVALLLAVFLVFGLSLFGVFEMGTSLASAAGQAQMKTKQEGYGASFVSGVFATAVATPCTGPFLGSALGYAVTIPALYSMVIFTFLGLGMAFPYLAIAAFPKLLRWMPRPGAWMESFKQFMGFLMLATVLWLLWVFGAQTSETATFIMLGAMLILSLACWIKGRWATPARKKNVRLAGYVLMLGCIFIASFMIRTALHFSDEAKPIASAQTNDKLAWEAFSKERIQHLQSQKVPVLVDFTAKWCLICQANHLILTNQEVEKKLVEAGVVRMKADWTKSDPAITEELKRFGRSGVPLYVLYTPDSSEEPIILPQVLTPENVISSIEMLKTNGSIR